MHRPSHYGEPPVMGAEGAAPPPGEDPYRAVDPERVDAFSRTLDRTVVEMHALGRSGRPIRGKHLARLAELARAAVLHAETFAAEVELAL